MKPRLLLLLAVLIGACGLAGCEQREPANPFLGPSGAASEMPFGALPATATPHRG